MILSHMPMEARIAGKMPDEGIFTKEGGGSQLYQDRVQTQEEIAEMIEKTFG